MKKICVTISIIIVLTATFLVMYFKPEITNPTASWNTYTNTKYGIVFKYPKEWILKEGRGDLNEIVELSNPAYPIRPSTDVPADSVNVNYSDEFCFNNNYGWNNLNVTGFADTKPICYPDQHIAIFLSAATNESQKIEEEIISSFVLATTSTQPGDIIQKGYYLDEGQSELTFISSDGKTLKIPKNIAMELEASGGVGGIGFIMPLNPLNGNEIIITNYKTSCSETSDTLCVTKNGFYSYNISTEKISELYKIDTNDAVDYQILGTQGSRLIMFAHTIGTSGVCDDVWDEGLTDPQRYKYLDLENITAGIRQYEVPSHLAITGEKILKNCQQNSL